jgi:hypothetical protein
MEIDDGTLTYPFAGAPFMLTAACLRQTIAGGTPREHRHTLKTTCAKAGLEYHWSAGDEGRVYTPYVRIRGKAFDLVRELDKCSSSGTSVSSTKEPAAVPHLCLALSALQKPVVTLVKHKETLRLT